MKFFTKKNKKIEEKPLPKFEDWYDDKDMKVIDERTYLPELHSRLLARKQLSQKSVGEIWSLIRMAMKDAYTAGQNSVLKG